MNNLLVEHYRCPKEVACFQTDGQLRERPGYFRFDKSTVGFGRLTTEIRPGTAADSNLSDLTSAVEYKDSKCVLPFDPDEVITNLRYERYVNTGALPNSGLRRLARNAYY